MSATVGATYRYAHELGLAEQHADELSAEMTELDMHPGTEVVVHDVDGERGGLVIVEWADRSNNPRLTSIDPALFAEWFEEVPA